MASVLDVNSEPTSGLQTFALFILFFFPGLALIVVGLRNAGRLATRQFGLDDWLITIAMFISVAETVFSYFYIKTNFVGIDESQIPPHDPTNGRIWNFAVQILYNPILALAKSSVLIFLLRLFGQKGGVRKFIICLNTFNILHMFGVFFALTFQCSPVAFAWDKTIRGGQCVEQRVLFTSNAVINIIVDFLILGLPLWIFVDLKIPKRAKVGLMFVFLLGFLVTITSIVRLVLLVQGLFGLVRGPGDTRNIGFITSAIETNLALITASAPALRPLLRSRDRGGWLPSLTRKADVEMASTEPELLASRASTAAGAARSGSSRGGKSSRGGSLRGGRRGGKSSRRGGKRPVALRDIRLVPAGQELRSQSPRSSEEETMTSNGIMRVSDVQREIDGLAKELVVVGTGSSSGGRGTGRGPRYPSGAEVTSEDIADLRRFPAARYLGGEGVYPDMEYRGERDYNEERLSRYGERRFGVVTPKTPKAPPPRWAQGGGQPF